MRNKSAVLLAVASLAIAGCMNRGLVPVGYDAPVARTSNKTASLQLFASVSDATRGTNFALVAPKVVAPISVGPYPELEFTLQDQRVFVESLGFELNRLKIVRLEHIFESAPPGDVAIGLAFGPTAHDRYMQQYLLDVVMRLESGGRTVAKRYQVFSADGETTWKKLNTSAAEGKRLGAEKLMRRLIPDIEEFVATQ